MFTYAKPEQKQISKSTVQKKDSVNVPSAQNQTGIPDDMKSRFENLSGFSFDDVKVHYNSGKPAQLQALAYTQGNQVHIAPGQEKHLGHELGHVVQQKQGIVKPTNMLNGEPLNTDSALEREADNLSAVQLKTEHPLRVSRAATGVVQLLFDFSRGFRLHHLHDSGDSTMFDRDTPPTPVPVNTVLRTNPAIIKDHVEQERIDTPAQRDTPRVDLDCVTYQRNADGTPRQTHSGWRIVVLGLAGNRIQHIFDALAGGSQANFDARHGRIINRLRRDGDAAMRTAEGRKRESLKDILPIAVYETHDLKAVSINASTYRKRREKANILASSFIGLFDTYNQIKSEFDEQMENLSTPFDCNWPPSLKPDDIITEYDRLKLLLVQNSADDFKITYDNDDDINDIYGKDNDGLLGDLKTALDEIDGLIREFCGLIKTTLAAAEEFDLVDFALDPVHIDACKYWFTLEHPT